MPRELNTIVFRIVLFVWVRAMLGLAQSPLYEKRGRQRFFVSDAPPFVPEDFRDYNNIIYNRIDYPELTEISKDEVTHLESLLLKMIRNESDSNGASGSDEVFVEAQVKYVGRGLWTNNGRNAKLAVSMDGFVCGQGDDSKCHYKRCHLELNETFLPPPWPEGQNVESRRENIHLLRWSCARKDRWCYVCRSQNSDSDSHSNGSPDIETSSWPKCDQEDPNSSDESLQKLNCNRQFGDLKRNKRYACSVHFTQVAGISTEVEKRSCEIVDRSDTSDEFGICQTDAVQYRSQCICHKSGCNSNTFVGKKIGSNFPEVDLTTKEIRASLRQLRADIERMIKKYSINFYYPDNHKPPYNFDD